MTEFHLSEIVEKITFRETLIQKAIGLMFKLSFNNEAYVFAFDEDRKIPIHMLFVFFPIDVIWINSQLEVVDIKKRVLPFTPAVYHRGRATTLIEFPRGTVDKHNIKLMDKLIIN